MAAFQRIEGSRIVSQTGDLWFEPGSFHKRKVPDFLRNQELFFCAVAVNVYGNRYTDQYRNRGKRRICALAKDLPMRGKRPGSGTMPAFSNEYLECIFPDHKALCAGPVLQAFRFFVKGIDTYILGS